MASPLPDSDRPLADDASLVDQVRERIDELLRSGSYPPGSRLPPERSLAERFGVNRLTVNKALGRFVDAGRLTRRVGSGTWVTDAPPPAPPAARALTLVDVFLPHNDRVGEGASAMLGRPGVIEGVHDYFRARRDPPVRTALAYFRDDAELAAALQRVAGEPGTAQVVWWRPGALALAALRALAGRGNPVCLVDCREPACDTHLVASDNFQGGLVAAQALTDAGRRRLAYLTQPLDQESLAERAEGVRRGALRADAQLAERILRDAAEVPAALDALWAAGAPDGIAASNDWIALAVLAELRRRGIAVPGEVALVGYDDVEQARYSDPALTTVSQDFAAIGFRAAEVVDRAFRSPAGPHRAQLLSPHLVRRAST
ncbi:MAG: substrate-binding domain-containing protein [Planctomycetes bacterium]|nr:substrate-binding domain-containing protein [Planctomycetota bacterium]